MGSLRSRLVLSLAAVLAVLVILTGIALERGFRDAARSAREERLLAQLYLLMAAAESDGGGLAMPETLAESRLSFPGSGLAARIFDAAGTLAWQSRSAVDAPEPVALSLPPGVRRFDIRRRSDGSGYLVGAFGVSWATGPEPRPYTFAVAEDLRALRAEIDSFRRSLYRSLGLMSLLVLAALALVLRWGLDPLRRVAAEVAALETGGQARIRGHYPSELGALTDNLNALIAQERARQERLDHALGDLAHSLKTPLAVMAGVAAESDMDPIQRQVLRDQLSRMGEIVEYQLQRARAGALHAGRLATPVPVGPTLERLGASLAKVYRDKAVVLEWDAAEGTVFRGAEGDLMELLGNLLDNAYKWCRGRVRVRVERDRDGLVLRIEDDGPGIGAERADEILARGVRGDEGTPGHGLGLAVVREICAAYGGGLEIGQSPLGGTMVRLWLKS